MLPLSPSLWLAVGAAVLIAGLSGAVYVQTSRLEAVRTEYATFKAEVKVLGEAAQKAADAQKASDKLKKEKADAYNKRELAGLADTVKRLHDERANSNLLPAPAPGSRSPEIAAFDRSQLERALSVFVEGAANLVTEGSQAVIDLNAAKEWAK